MNDSSNSTVTLTNTEIPIFALDLGPEAGVLQPRSLDELSAWLETERNFWSWTSTAPVAGSVPEGQRQLLYVNDIAQVIGIAREGKSTNNDAQYARSLEQIKQMLVEKYVQHRALHSSSPRSHFVASMEDKIAAAYAIRYFSGLSIASPGNPIETKGVVNAIAFDAGYGGRLEEHSQQAAADRLQQMAQEHESLRRQAGKLQDDYSKLSTEIVALYATQKRDYEEARTARKVEFDALLETGVLDIKSLRDSSAEELKQIGETYDKKLALQSAVTYLNQKSSQHLRTAILMSGTSLAAGVAFGFLALRVGATLLAGDKPSWPNVAVAALTATLCFWLLRILVRMFLSNLHLATDARNRSTLMQTYLALLREGGALKDDDRGLVLKMLFRPFSDGLVKDDGTPPGIWDLATRVTGGKG